jgi:hypothetical protein
MSSLKKFIIKSSAAILFFVACLLTVLTQLSKSQAQVSVYPNAELEIQSLNQVEEINSDHFKTYELSPSQND